MLLESGNSSRNKIGLLSTIIVSLAACNTPQTDRIYFCTLEGEKLPGTFINKSLDAIVFDDVLFRGNFDCGEEGGICFQGSQINFEFDAIGSGTKTVVNDMPWGDHEWKMDYNTGHLYFRTILPRHSSIRTCDPVISQNL